ncbi:Chitinase 1 [Linnemannia gamsii]|uniref:chitinase n=1 Tax=Linnemannia gamsii TaxID=64522 RepID=A0ABQ7KE80_9FUNG|nr:Chitinase 1 [Linnemannia gamsii]
MTRPATMLSIAFCLGLIPFGLLGSSVSAFDPRSDNNLVNYWGQNSYGAAGGDMRFWQKPLGDYCQTSGTEDVIVLAFLHVFNSASRGLPRMDLSNQCDQDTAFPGTGLLHCSRTGQGVKMCQSKGKAVILSLGGAAGAYGFSDDAEAKDFAHTIWNLFLGGSSGTRPLDDAILDGVDLDIEGGSAVGYPAFIAELRSLFAADSRKQYYITAAPQCPFPDAYLGATLQSAWVDMVFVQYYNNYCGTQAYGSLNFNFEQWDNWAKTISVNKDVKVYLGVPASRTAANAGYVGIERLQEIMDSVRCKYSSFGGVMMWDISQSYGNLEPGTEYNVAAAKSLKRPRNVVCGSDSPAEAPAPVPVPSSTPAPPPPVPAPPPSEPAPPAPSPPTASEPALTPAPPTASAPASTPAPPTASAPASSPAPPTASAPASTPSVPSFPTDNKGPSSCPIKGAPCTPPTNGAIVCDGYNFATCLYGQWILQACAKGTYCTPQGCNFIKGPVKSCTEAETERKAEAMMKKQMRETIDLMWGVFDNVLDTTWDSYTDYDYEMDEDDDDVNTPAQVVNNDKQNDASHNKQQQQHQQQQHQQQQQQPQQQQQQKPFTLPENVIHTEAQLSKVKDTFDDYLIDFVELEAGQDFVSFALDPTEAETSKAFRTQIRIRTNGEAIDPLWRISFFVKPDETVKSVSRGTFIQNGPRVFITSKPKEEAHKSMVIRFVMEGVRTAVDPLANTVNPNTVSPDSESSQEQRAVDLLAPVGLPDPAFAKFETKAVRLH